jgi:hypothetical protein
MLGYIRGTTTKTGLTVTAYLDEGIYRKGHKVTSEVRPMSWTSTLFNTGLLGVPSDAQANPTFFHPAIQG